MAIRIELEHVESSTIKAIGYDMVRRILAVKFETDAIRHYAGVPQEVALEFYSAPSKGQYYNLNIRGKYEAEPMTGDCPKCGARNGWIGDTCEDCGCAEYAPKPKPLLHYVFPDELSAKSKRARKAACGRVVGVSEVAKLEYAITCPDCKSRRDAADQPF